MTDNDSDVETTATDAEDLDELNEDELLEDDDLDENLDVEDDLEDDELGIDPLSDEEEEETVVEDDRGDGTTRVLPKQPGEFVCQSCFLVKSETQLADPKRKYCRDCV